MATNDDNKYKYDKEESAVAMKRWRHDNNDIDDDFSYESSEETMMAEMEPEQVSSKE
jgi:hypothetical protein